MKLHHNIKYHYYHSVPDYLEPPDRLRTSHDPEQNLRMDGPLSKKKMEINVNISNQVRSGRKKGIKKERNGGGGGRGATSRCYKVLHLL